MKLLSHFWNQGTYPPLLSVIYSSTSRHYLLNIARIIRGQKRQSRIGWSGSAAWHIKAESRVSQILKMQSWLIGSLTLRGPTWWIRSQKNTMEMQRTYWMELARILGHSPEIWIIHVLFYSDIRCRMSSWQNTGSELFHAFFCGCTFFVNLIWFPLISCSLTSWSAGAKT